MFPYSGMGATFGATATAPVKLPTMPPSKPLVSNRSVNSRKGLKASGGGRGGTIPRRFSTYEDPFSSYNNDRNYLPESMLGFDDGGDVTVDPVAADEEKRRREA